MKSLNETSIGTCHKVYEFLPERVCIIPLKARTGCSPRFEPEKSDIRSLIQPNLDGYVPQLMESVVHKGIDVPDSWLETPDDAMDVVQILSNRRELIRFADSSGLVLRRFLQNNTLNATSQWHMVETLQGECDGHEDRVGGIVGDESSGELVLTLDQISEGIVVMIIGDVNPTVPSTDDGYVIDININGTLKTISKNEIQDAKQRFGFVPIADRLGGTVSDNVTIRIQVRNCKSTPCNIMLTHIYWA